MKRIAVLIMILTIISKLLGFSRELVLSYFYGTSFITDAYLISLTIPGTIFAFIGIGISTNFIPLYTIIEKNEDSYKANIFMNNVINFILLIATIIFIITFIFAEKIVKLFAMGFEGEVLRVAVLFTKIGITGVYFYGLIYIFSGFLNIKKNFITPVLTSLPFNLTVIASVILGSIFGNIILAIGSLLAIIFQLLFLLIPVIKNKYKYKFIFNLRNKNLKKMIYLSIPVILGTSVNQINRLVDRTIASSITIGGISALNYASRLNHFILGIFVISIATVVFPSFSKMSIEKNYVKIKRLLLEITNIVFLIIIPVTIMSMIFSRQIVDILFARGAFNSNSILLTTSSLFFYSLGLIGFGLREIISRVFYAMNDTRTPMINASIGMFLNIILNIILSRYLGIGGIALATSISAIFTAFLLYLKLNKKIGSLGFKTMSISFIKILLTALITGILTRLSFIFFINSLNQNVSLLISLTFGFLLYFTIIYFIKIKEVNVIVKAIKDKFLKSSGK
jgi:putative peptidoglycan lipid II flippase